MYNLYAIYNFYFKNRIFVYNRKIEYKGTILAYFPMFYSMNNKKILLIGAGKISCEKLEKLLDFTKEITIISPQINEYIIRKSEEFNLNIIKREYKEGDIKDFDIVIVAVDDFSLQERIYSECKEENILCNCVDLQEYCDFIFPSYIKEGDLTLAISTSGSSPAFAKRFKEYLKDRIPDDISSFLQNMRTLRNEIPKGKERMKLLDEKVKEYIKSWN